MGTYRIMRITIATATLLFSSLASSTNAGFFDQFEWTEVNPGSSAIWEPRAGLQAVKHRGKFYVMGGRNPNPVPQAFGDSFFYNDVWTSSDSGVSWEQKTDSFGAPWDARAYFQAVTKGRYIYVLGGQDSTAISNPDPTCGVAVPPGFCPPSILQSNFFNDVWRSRDGTNWQRMTGNAKWEARAGLSAVTHRGWIYVMAGSVNDDSAIIGPGGPSRIYFNDVYRSRDGKRWQKVIENAPWAPRAGSVVLSRGKYMYLLGGEDGFVCNASTERCPPYFNDVWRSKDGRHWTQVTADAGWSPRPGHQCEILFGYFICFGGFGLSEAALQPPGGPFPPGDSFPPGDGFPLAGAFPTGDSGPPADPFEPSNPVDIWASADGANWRKLGGRAAPPWNADGPADIKYDFAAFPVYFVDGKFKPSIFTFGGDRETFDPDPDSMQFLNVDNDTWRFSPEWR